MLRRRPACRPTRRSVWWRPRSDRCSPSAPVTSPAARGAARRRVAGGRRRGAARLRARARRGRHRRGPAGAVAGRARRRRDADPGSLEVVRYLSGLTGDEPVLWVLAGGDVPRAFEPISGPTTSSSCGSIRCRTRRSPPCSRRCSRRSHRRPAAGWRTWPRATPSSPRRSPSRCSTTASLVEGDDGRWAAVGDID